MLSVIRPFVFGGLLLLSTVCLSSVFHPSALAAQPDPLDWPSWRGPHQNGVSNESGLIERFDPADVGDEPDSNVVWKSEAASGISTPIVMNGRLFTIVRDKPDTKRDAEKVIALDAASGEVLWENVYNVFLSDLPAERVGWSNVCGDPETDRVYAFGACCLFQCIDGATGKTIWSRSLSEEFGMLSTYGGRTNTPVVYEDLVIISGVTTGWDENARPAHRFLAFEKNEGELVWLTATRPLPEDTTYSTPIITQIGGQDVMVAGSGDGDLYGIQPRTGRILWREPLSRRGINTSPVIDNQGNIYAAHGEENPEGTAMGAVVSIEGPVASLDSASAERWRTEELTVGKSSPLLIDGRLYVVEDSSRLHVLDTETGEEIGKPMKLGTAMRGSLLYADGKIYAATASGIVHILRPTESGVKSVFKVRLPKGHDVGGSMIASHGRIYLPTTGGLYCLSDKSKAQASSSRPQLSENAHSPSQTGQISDSLAAQLQLIPAEAIVQPGETLRFTVNAFNSLGRRVASSTSDLSFEVIGAGQIDASGTYMVPDSENNTETANDGNAHRSATILVKAGGLTGIARVRVIPSLPWTFKFDDNTVPITWIGARYRHEARKVEGEPLIVKISTIPKGTRSQTWFGPTDLHDYTVTADVKAQDGTAKLPDMGIIAQRYTLDLMGESQQLQIRTWAAQLRMAQSTTVSWQAGVWYRLKLQASVEDGTAVLKGKVWPREDPEPSEWTVTATDEAPNVQGSPGLFGNATNAEIYIDNVTVTSNP
ncbi:outer membrane biogenesis protein BamB [Rubripirellula amarantea]|uniref:Outer membrane biogenesis protein BamB n=1 Tax=Rubripirellula amarantea TaxID=2527999 RepID=A0A5C5WX95_9BACT|nr:PQQ-binding-like beta-propeller repeat protein [Rubripirellula amarantea]TWT54613.1 outer membrane biogenesis protein BamB [Rubripirellula amarantea]